MKKNIKFEYEYNIFNKVNAVKDRVLFHLSERKDYQQILTTADKPTAFNYTDYDSDLCIYELQQNLDIK